MKLQKPNPKNQGTPNTKEASNLKSQEPAWSRPRPTFPARSAPIWWLDFGIYLELGAWSLELSIVMTPLTCYLLLSSLLFSIGLAGAVTRRNAIVVLIGIELMLNAANLNFIAFWRYGANPQAITGIMFVIFSIGVAAAEAAVGLALIISIYRHYKSANVDQMDRLKG